MLNLDYSYITQTINIISFCGPSYRLGGYNQGSCKMLHIINIFDFNGYAYLGVPYPYSKLLLLNNNLK